MSSCSNFKIFVSVFQRQHFLELNHTNRSSFTKFISRNHKLPIRTNIYDNNAALTCDKCNQMDIGDEFHYLFKCSFFASSRVKYIPYYYRQNPSVYKTQELFKNASMKALLKISIFMNIIMKEFC